MTVMPRLKTDTPTTTTDTAYTGDRTVRVFSIVVCPRCLARLHASALRDLGEGEYAWTCQRCHSDVVTITNG
jgi:ribosomal protein L40E